MGPYLRNGALLECPSVEPPGKGSEYPSYGVMANLMGYRCSRALCEIENSAQTALIADAAQLTKKAIGKPPSEWRDYVEQMVHYQWTPPSNWTGSHSYAPSQYESTADEPLCRPLPRHHGGFNVGFVDGHCKWQQATQFLGQLPQGWEYGDPNNAWDSQ
ncbi:MAG: hypothetical protein ACYC63_14215 [Armatimonadota bacterium]